MGDKNLIEKKIIRMSFLKEGQGSQVSKAPNIQKELSEAVFLVMCDPSMNKL
jgi:hypothetical protein